ncbi:putative protein tyrosine phosphatase [Gregarina niphandrodes]|uniref:very-long-chain (3R)-3-hydroxyacyl-CoA dehydratase n=1 Tax=Gregarina niphandrodes TaxID=110365 RepID=A0A023B618_GRENI|nr:putative protein tyrosine phosphatase [Gregarina niphandrodes]EZG65033.1 putative protein tyrosine phosphatase [Gregarina niphandrodes]|eukprot:XP_011134109.1 putative protein tyrosine phosphatase [Gregarina niphandrodes]
MSATVEQLQSSYTTHVTHKNARTSYLVTYNCCCLFVWFLIGLRTLMFNPIYPNNRRRWYDKVGFLVSLATALPILEVVHAAIGLVRSDAVTTFMQVASRMHVSFFIWRLLPVTHLMASTALVITAWTLSEFCRYPFYIFQLIRKDVPYCLKWLRYSAFLVLYPLGILGEVLTMVKAVDLFKTSKFEHWPVPMPNRMNFELNLSYVYMWVLLLYVPGSVHMYSHMCLQRKKALKGCTSDKSQ